jgi:hypothetical protein
MNNFWDTPDAHVEFDFDIQKKKLIENLNYLHSMSVEEQTLYKKWVELQESNTIMSKGQIATFYDLQWKPTDIFDKQLTIRELEELEPYVQIVEDPSDVIKWSQIRKMISSMEFTANPGRNIKIFVKDRVSEKILGVISLGSDVTSLAVRDNYIGWTKEDKFKKGKLNYTTIGTSIVPTQPLGYNFLGGKLISMMTTVPSVREYWKTKYGQTLVAVGTTSLYGIHSQYNGIPHFKTLGESAGKIAIKPDDQYYEVWHRWLKENRTEWYSKNVLEEVNGEKINPERSGPVSGIKQRILSKIYSECGIKISDYHHGFKRGVYLAMMYENGCEFLRSEIQESELIIKPKFEQGLDYINEWWKRKAISRYIKLYDEGKLKNEHLFYIDGVGSTWEEFRTKNLKEVGR